MLTCVTSIFPWTSPSVCTPCPSDCTYSELWGHAMFLSGVTASHVVKVLAQKWHPQCCSNMTTLVHFVENTYSTMSSAQQETSEIPTSALWSGHTYSIQQPRKPRLPAWSLQVWTGCALPDVSGRCSKATLQQSLWGPWTLLRCLASLHHAVPGCAVHFQELLEWGAAALIRKQQREQPHRSCLLLSFSQRRVCDFSGLKGFADGMCWSAIG